MIRLGGCSKAALALVLALSACSADRGGGEADAAPKDRTTTTAIESLHDGLVAPTGSPLAPPHQGEKSPAGSPTSVTTGTPKAGGRSTSTSAPVPGTSTSTTATTTATTTTTVPPGLPAEKCPDAKSCRRYAFSSGEPRRWRVVDGRATIAFEVNPTGCGLSADVMRQAMEHAARPWELAAPTLDFVFSGFTDRAPVPHDGHNVVACTGPNAATPSVGNDGFVAEADMLLRTGAWTYSPCEQADNSCTLLGGRGGSLDISTIATHEFGHWLWLADMNDHELERELTMSPGDSKAMNEGSRHWSTLALGDILGIRALYPCSCPLPPVYTP